jgi:hypothetical protein
MAKLSVPDWDQVADNNTDIAGINIAEKCPAGGMNDMGRTIMAQVATLLPTLVRSGANVVNDLLGTAVKRFGNASTIYDTLGTPAERSIGYRTLPLTPQRTAAYTIALSDVAFGVPITTGGITVPTNATVPFSPGDLVVILNTGTASQAITPASGVTVTLAATTSTGARSVVQNGVATLLKLPATDTWLIYGVGVS